VLFRSIRLSFTNKACININGDTIDSFLKITDDTIDTRWASKLKADYVIVDEISMLDAKHWSYLCDLKRITNAKFILLGDFRQCAPIEMNDDFNNKTVTEFKYISCINFLAEYNRIEFNVYNPNCRYDIKLWDISHEVFKSNLQSCKSMETDFNTDILINATNICYLNATRKQINQIVNYKLKPNNAIFIPNDNQNDYSQDTYIYRGMKVILNNTIKSKSKDEEDKKQTKIFMKNQTALITKIENNIVTIDDKYDFPIDKFHDICLMGYASTIHKSQGDTCSGIVNLFDFNHKMMNGNLRYTAITRARLAENIRIMINVPKPEFIENIGYIYKLTCSKSGKCYIGSTRDFDKRFKQHINKNNDCMSRFLIDPVFQIIAKFSSISSKQLLKMEQQYINASSFCINKQSSCPKNKDVISTKTIDKYTSIIINPPVNVN